MFVNVTRKDHIGRRVTLYESSREVIHELAKKLAEGQRCLAICAKKTMVMASRGYLNPYSKKSYYFTSDVAEERSYVEFKKSPEEFIQKNKPQLLFCSPVLRSGVSFEHQFDEVFIMVDTEHFTDRDIIQMLSRERHWKEAHIYTNMMNVEVPKVGTKGDHILQALTLLEKEKRNQLLIRPMGVASRLADRGAEVIFQNGNVTPVILEDMPIPNYVSEGEDGRKEFEDYVLSIIAETNKPQSIRSVVKARQKLEATDGAKEALNRLFNGDYFAFHDYLHSKKPMFRRISSYKTLGNVLKGWGIDDSGFFKGLFDDGLNRSNVNRSKQLKSKLLSEAPKPDDERYKKAKEHLRVLFSVLKDVDRYETNDRDVIEMLLEPTSCRLNTSAFTNHRQG